MYYNKYLIIGGDLRNISLAQHLIADGNKVEIYGFSNYTPEQNSKIAFSQSLSEAIENAEIIIGAIPCSLEKGRLNAPFNDRAIQIDKVIGLMRDDQIFIAGMIPGDLASFAEENGIKTYDILEREEMAVLNAIPTSEGAIQLAMEEMKITLHSANIMILGYGRIGKILAKTLDAMGANVNIAVRTHQDKALVRAFGYYGFFFDKLPENLNSMDVIFNTVPVKVLDKSNLKYVKKECLIIELASAPYGVDYESSKREGLKVMYTGSLPGKVAPITAAKYIAETVYNIIKED